MNIYVFDRNMEIKGIIDSYKSIIWTTRYFKEGDFELYLNATAEYVNLLHEEYYLCREEDISGDEYRNVMVIKNIHITTDEEEGNFLEVTGPSLKSIIGRRIVWQQTNLNGTVEAGIRKVITENIISPSITARKINNFVLADAQNLTDKMDIQVTGDNIAEWVKKICMTYGMGWDVFIKGKSLVFYLWKGVDRSYNQSENIPVIFSDEYDNILASDYALSTENFKNVALVAGEGEGLSRKTQVVGNASDLDRYELYVDSRDVSTNEGEITAADYDKLLQAQGLEALSETIVTETFEGSIEPNVTYVLNRDYFLGDIVQVVNEYGISSAPRIIEIIDSEDETGRSIIPTYSTTVDLEV